MSVELEIRDGVPHWWNSPDIWVVPGADPDGPPGQPVAGIPAYMWAKVRNNGSTPANGARIKFYWSNPATGVLRSNSTYIGSSFVYLNPGEVQDVLCLTPWLPVVVNDGHECIIAEVIHPSHPLPSPLPDQFDPPNYLQIAQLNLSVLSMTTNMLILPIQLAAPPRKKMSLDVTVQFGEQIDRRSLEQLGIGKLKLSKKALVNVDLSLERGCGKYDKKRHSSQLTIDLAPGTSRAVYLRVEPGKLKAGYYTPIDVVARERDTIFGGITFIATRSEGE
jgi:hypothetical protein